MEQLEETKKNVDPLGGAVEFIMQDESSISLDNPSVRDSFMIDLGVIKGLQFSELSIRYAKAVKLWKLTQNKAYKKLGITFKELCEKIGLKATTGRTLLEQIELFGEQGYKALLGTGLKLKDINFLAKAKPDVKEEGNVTTIQIGDEAVPADDKDAIERLIQNLENEKKSLQKKIEILENDKDEALKANAELKEKMLENAEPGKAVANAKRTLNECVHDFNSIVKKLNDLLEKKNTDITSEVMRALLSMDHDFITLRDYIRGDEDPETLVPEEMIHTFGKK